MNELLITNGTLVTWGEENALVPDGALLIRDDTIAEIGDTPTLTTRYPEVDRLDAEGQLVMPGNICAHTHFYSAFARGMSIPGAPMKDFPDILERLWWRLDQVLTMEDVRYSALVCMVDAIKHGTTTLIDHHASPNAISGSLDEIASAATAAGLRTALCYEVSDRSGPGAARAGIAENVRWLQQISEEDFNPLLAGTFGLHASLSLSDETLADCVAAARQHGSGFHIHVAEHEADEYDALHNYGRRTVDRLAYAGFLGPKSIVAHGVHVDAAEMQLLKDTSTWVTHQPRSNMNNAVGAADIESMLRLGIPVCLGNDGFSNNMWAEWKTAYLLHKVVHRDPRRADGSDIAKMAIENNSRLAEMLWQRPIGALVEGAAADLIFVAYHPTTPLNAGNLPWHILFGFESSMVTATIVAGQVLMHRRRLLTLDEKEITARSRELAADVWRRFEEISEYGRLTPVAETPVTTDDDSDETESVEVPFFIAFDEEE